MYMSNKKNKGKTMSIRIVKSGDPNHMKVWTSQSDFCKDMTNGSKEKMNSCNVNLSHMKSNQKGSKNLKIGGYTKNEIFFE